jgi:RNA polymerase sigma factor (sigma-70 family)
MTASGHELAPLSAGARVFPTTHWTVVLTAAQEETTEGAEALELLCRGYWYPLYAFVRRQGYSSYDAQDLTQAFFARFLEKKYLDVAQPSRGRFRWFLLASLRHFLANEWDRARAEKRGGGKPHIPIDQLLAEHQYSREPAHELTAEKLYERAWALTLLEKARARLRAEYVAADRSERFNILEQFLPGEDIELTYTQVGHKLGIAEGTVKAEVHYLRRRYRELLRAEVAQTVASPEEIVEEIRHLIAALGA